MRIVKGRPLQDCFADLPRPLCLLPPQVPSSQKVANRVFTQSLHSASLSPLPFVVRLLIPAPFLPLHSVPSFTHCLHLLAGSHVGLCPSSQASNASTVSCSRYGTASRTLRFVHLPVSAGGHFHKGTFFAIRKHRIIKIQLLLAVAVSTPFVLAAKHFLVLQVGT